MGRALMAMLTLLVVAAPAVAQQRTLPETPEGRLVAGFLAAVNSSDEEALGRFQAANFSEAALKRRSPEERAERNRSLREQTGGLTLVEVRSASSSQIVLVANGASLPKDVLLTVTFTFAGKPPKIDGVQISQQ